MITPKPQKKQVKRGSPEATAADLFYHLEPTSCWHQVMTTCWPVGKDTLKIWNDGYGEPPFLSSPPYHELYIYIYIQGRTQEYKLPEDDQAYGRMHS